MSFQLSPTLAVPEDIQELLVMYVKQIDQQWSADLCGLVLFGSAARGDFILGRSNINILLVLQHLSVDVLQRGGKLHQQWAKHKFIAPLLMTEKDVVRSQSLFPLELLHMTQSHVLLSGQDPFGEVQIDTTRLGWQCEQELMANVLRIRQRFIEGEGRVEAVQALLLLSITAVLPCIRGLLYCVGHASTDKDQKILEALHETLKYDPTLFLEILSFKRGISSPGVFEWPKLYQRYLDNLEVFIERVQEIRQEGLLCK
jgi:predicted nucleotidyltransferase